MSPPMNEQELLHRLGELPREIQPARDPWPEISARMDEVDSRVQVGHSSRNWWLGAAAASVFLAFFVGVLMKPVWDSGPLPSVGPTGENQLAVNVGTAPGLVDIVDAEYLAAFREFINVGGSRDSLTPQTIEKIEMGWADLRQAETDLTTALQQNPEDAFLSQKMLELRARQLGFLKQLVQLDRNNRRMTT